MEAKDLAKLENDARTALIQAIGGGVLLLGFFATVIGLTLTWRNLQITQATAMRNLATVQAGQITERFIRAIEQLGALDQGGKKKLEVRLGGIYALEQIAKDSPDHYWPIMQVLTAYVRENAPWDPAFTKWPTFAWRRPPADIEAVLTVLR